MNRTKTLSSKNHKNIFQVNDIKKESPIIFNFNMNNLSFLETNFGSELSQKERKEEFLNNVINKATYKKKRRLSVSRSKSRDKSLEKEEKNYRKSFIQKDFKDYTNKLLLISPNKKDNDFLNEINERKQKKFKSCINNIKIQNFNNKDINKTFNNNNSNNNIIRLTEAINLINMSNEYSNRVEIKKEKNIFEKFFDKILCH